MSVDQTLECSDKVRDFVLHARHDSAMLEETAIPNASFDLLEQHQAKEQTRLLQRFRELRQWQQQQQQQLMHQQQQQLQNWQDEQSKVQLLIATQKGAHWNKGLKPGGQKSPVLTPPSRPYSVAGNNTQKDSGQANQSHGAGISIDSGLAASMQDTLKSQGSLPKPVMYIDPSKYLNPADEDKYTNSELFSNPGSHDDQLDILREDDSRPAPGWMSDNSDNFIPPKLPPPRPIRQGRSGDVDDQLAGLEQLLNTAPVGLLQQVLKLLPAKARTEAPTNYTDEIELSASPTLPKQEQQQRARKLQFHPSQPVTVIQSSGVATASFSQHLYQQHQLQQKHQQQHENNGMKKIIPGPPQNLNLGSVLAEPEQDPHQITRAFTLMDGRMGDSNLPLGVYDGDDGSNDEWEDQEEDEEDDCSMQNVTAKEVTDTSRDDRPIHGIAGKKSFEQLLEEHLKAEERKLENNNMAYKPHRKPFLKKGEGISRFNSAPKKPVKQLSRKSTRKSPLVQVNGSSADTARVKHGPEGNPASDSADGNKRLHVGSGVKDMKKPPTFAAKSMERKIKSTTKNSSGSQEATADKSAAKLALIHNAAQKKIEEQKSQQKELGNYKVDKDPSEHINNEDLSEVDRSPSVDSKSHRSDDRDSTELDSLAEFELLEDAMDNISFRSNSSYVQKLLTSDRQGQKEVMNKLRTINESKKADNNIRGGASFDQPETSRERDCNSFAKAGVTGVGVDHNLNGNHNINNNSNIGAPETESESSDVTLTDSSDEDNGCGRTGLLRNSETSSANGVVGNSTSASNFDSLPSPSKVMPRKVAPLASKFSAATDTLSMLKSLSLQANILTKGQDCVSTHASNNSTSKQGFVSAAVSSSASDLQGFLASTSLVNHHSIQPGTNYSLASSDFSENNSVPNNFKLMSAPVLYGDATQSSLAFYQKSWLESKPMMSSMSSSQIPAENASKFSSQGMSSDTKCGIDPHKNKYYDSHHYEHSSDKSSDENDSSEESDDDIDKVDRVEFASEEEDSSIGGNFGNQIQSGNRKATDSVEQQDAVAPSTCYNDESSWVDEDEDSHDTENKTCLKIVGPSAPTTGNNATTPPTSKLMSKLFPKLKSRPSIETEKANQALQQASAQPVQMSNGLQSRILREKLMELDAEIERFRSENANLEMLRREREEGLAKLKQEIENFQREKENELKRLEEFKAEEVKKLKRERKLFDSYQKKVRSMPDKREREEIDALKSQLQELQDELKHKESRWNASTARLKNRLAELELENGELKEEIRILEKKRLEWMTVQSNAKASVQSNGKVGHAESGSGKSGGGSKQALTPHMRSSTPTKEMDKAKVSSSGLRDNFSAANTAVLRPAVSTQSNGVAKNVRSGTGSSIVHKTQGGSSPLVQNGGETSISKAMALKQQSPAIVHTSYSGEGLQNNSVPVMMENTLPVAAQVSAMPGSLASSMNSSGKSAALRAMEQAVIDKGDVSAFVEVKHQDGKIEKTYKTGAKEIYFPNGTVKEISADGQTIVCRLANGDIRQIFPDHRVVYIFAEAEIMQTTFPDGLETFQFKNGQIERRYPDGTVEITFPSKDVKYLFPDGGQEVILTDGTVMQYNSKGERIVEYPSGDREVHTAEYQRREFPDGIVKTIYSDGRHETRFPNGRIRLRDKAGNVIMDQIVYR